MWREVNDIDPSMHSCVGQTAVTISGILRKLNGKGRLTLPAA